ncbi:uncharacterized protein C2845_PM14G18130 [Panicum miliaceum]|uniref:WLM domain-containing protein n=1 Tax=Panicum miliaceum TaxID=4540 RepID=A0A3L6PRT2_PANMI|nr:uncharacterized protein C2845_PM14G18130 [Panicum miliaceum]
MEESRIARISVTWRGRQLDVDADPSCTVKEFGQLLQDLTSVKPDTLKLIVPQSTNKGSKLITPFLDPHSTLTLNEAAISELNPPPSEALKRMHMLACDPGIIVIMNKHKWRVGIMTEMAPVGYVGVSPKCILGFNKAHMVHSEHDANFFALNKQLNEEAASLDWTKSRGHMLNGRKVFDSYEDEFVLEPGTTVAGHRLGGELSSLASARALSGAAAYQRFLNASAKEDHVSGTETEYNPAGVPQDFVQGTVKVEPDPDDAMHIDSAIVTSGSLGSRSAAGQHTIGYSEPNDVGKQSSIGCLEPDPDDSQNVNILNQELRFDGRHHSEPDPDDGANGFILESGNKMEVDSELTNNITVLKSEPDPDDSLNTVFNQKLVIDGKHGEEPYPDDTTCLVVPKSGDETQVITEQSRKSTVLKSEPDPDDHFGDLNSNELQRIEEPWQPSVHDSRSPLKCSGCKQHLQRQILLFKHFLRLSRM